ncbi:MAG: hypothetical protein GQ546_09100 [Gammaproteobacteria bacterium]|nr:hypothetical protein [Gammaproteobacteria bacterium]
MNEHDIVERLRKTKSAYQGLGRDRFDEDDFRISIAGAQEKNAFLLIKYH